MDSEIIIEAADIGRVAAEIGKRLENYLYKGNALYGLKGLEEGPRLMRREGTTQALFTWNDATTSFDIDLELLTALKLATSSTDVPPGFTVVPRLVQWRSDLDKWVTAYDADLTSDPYAPYLELDETINPDKVSYQLRGSSPMPYNPTDLYTSIILKPGTDEPAPDEGSTGDWSEDEWMIVDTDDPTQLSDISIWDFAKVVFFDDDPPGVPHVRIARLIPTTGLENWGDVHISEWTIVVTIHANQFEGTVTKGYDPDSADLLLGGAVWQMVGNYDGMKAIGLTNSEVKVGTPVELKLETTFPMTITCEVYSINPNILP